MFARMITALRKELFRPVPPLLIEESPRSPTVRELDELASLAHEARGVDAGSLPSELQVIAHVVVIGCDPDPASHTATKNRPTP